MYYSTKLLFYKTKKQFRRNINILKKEINSNYISKVNKDKNLLFLILKTKNKTKLLNFTRKYNIFLSSYWCIPNLLKNKKLSHSLYKNLVFLPNNNNLKKVQLVYLSKKINLFFKKHEN